MTAPLVHKANGALGDFSRRRFLATGGLLLAFADLSRVGVSIAAASDTPARSSAQIGGFVRISSDNEIALIVPNIEMGQGIYTAEAMLIAEELEVNPGRITVLTALPQDVTDMTPPLLRSLSTGGSRSIRKSWTPLRQAGAVARLMLVSAAAEKWNVSADSLIVEDGTIKNPASNEVATYGDLAVGAIRQPVPATVKLKPPTAWKLVGQSIPRVDIPDKLNGHAVFGIDVRVPGMVYGAIMGCPFLGGSVVRFDDRAARAIPGVLDILSIGSAIAVIARKYWIARKGLAALDVTWSAEKYAHLSTDDVLASIKNAADHVAPVTARDDRRADTAQISGKKIDSAYQSPFLAHAAMEPLNATIHVHSEGCDVWMGTQVPTRARQAVAAVTGIPEKNVAIHNHMIGGSFGRRLATDFLEQAAKFACKTKMPVKFIWSREEDIRQDLFRPAYYDRVSATLGADGQPLVWTHHVSGPSVMDRFTPGGLPVGKLDHDAVAGAADTPYELPNMHVIWTRADTPVPVSWWRGVGPAHNVYVVESFIDELAFEAGADPIAYRKRLLKNNPRSVAVLELAAEKSDWNSDMPEGVGRGVALHNAFGTHCAVVAEVAIEPTKAIKISKVTAVVDCGMAVNPDTLVAQIEGGLLFGFTAALYGEITLEGGRIDQSNFHNYRLMRINEAPHVEVHIVNSGEEPGGIGEVGTAAAFPALSNALFSATKERYRKYPFKIK
ncbi:xanthine dehydrogenase family protein molybdopterin-binding subunit [Acetobacter sacchari]|uniref:Xanthine dehydrogenase family protein molybdopterin-binding subunit n=1 Tax=Acetobacter sacchari TaxID=2661687 RepID=A0ABS3LRE6_9PROT|nr:molybdopterin cofactor-binding domain-containing protein [Acetobacter sacchari]MBO1358497.1 xanthine dehydrogenase family protein molybdopterin-binding subunit [Acetobacter sacchari]